MAYNQLNHFLENLDSSIHKHIVMFYEEPEYARLIQIRFLHDGLKRGECCVYAARDDDDLQLMKREMMEYGIVVEKFSARGLLQFYMTKPQITDAKSYKNGRAAFHEVISKQFSSSQGTSVSTLPKIRGVGSIHRELFSTKVTERNATMTSSQLLVEELFQLDNTSSFNNQWMCAYQVDDISLEIDSEWMVELLRNHDAVLFLQKYSRGIGLNLK